MSKDAFEKLKPIADKIGIAVQELWKVFVKRYVAKGVSEIVIALLLDGLAIYKLGGSNWVLIPLFLMMIPLYDGVNLLISPGYYALKEIMRMIRD